MDFIPLDYFRRADDAAKRGDIEERIRILRELLSLCQLSSRPSDYHAETLRRLGNAFHDKSDIPRAHSYRLEALAMVSALGNECSESVAMLVHGDLGRSFIELNELTEAESHTQLALEVAEANDDNESASIFRMNMSLIMFRLGDIDEAIALSERILTDAESLEEPHYVQALQNLNLSSMHLHKNQLNVCQQHARRSLVFGRFCHEVTVEQRALKVLGDSYLRSWQQTGRTEYAADAETYLRQVSKRASSAGDFSIVASTELKLAQLARGQGDANRTALHCQSAIEALEKVREVMGFEEYSQAFFKEWEDTYERVAQFQLKQQNPIAAFITSERSRNRLLLARLGTVRPNVARWTTARQSELSEILDTYGSEVIRACRSDLTRGRARSRTVGLRTAGDASAEPPFDPPGIQDARRRYVQLQEKQRLYGAHWTSPLMSPTVDPSFIQASLTDDDALLTFQVCDEGFIVFVMTRDSLHFENVPYPRQKLASDVQRVCEGFGVLEGRSLARLDNPILRREWWSRRPGEKHPEDIEKPLQQLLSELEKVFAILIAPVLSLAHAKPHWVIVPHGVLHRVPWAALWTGSHYLIEEHSVGLLPSASFGTTLRQRDQSSGNEVLLMGAPDPIHDSLGLPGAAAELRAAQKALGVTGQPRVAADATKETFLKEGGSARLIHVAAHHFFDGSAPGLSFLKLAGDTGARFLYANEVAELRLGAQLVVLSACETARSHVVAGDEQYGMIRSFLAAGARSIVSTLWAIEDESAAQIFSLFYQNATRRPLAQALANAQRGMMKTPPYDLPYFWAPYVLSGEWDRPLSMQPS